MPRNFLTDEEKKLEVVETFFLYFFWQMLKITWTEYVNNMEV